MEQPATPVSSSFRRKGIKAMLSIFVFILTYFLLIAGVSGMMYFGAYFSFLLITAHPSGPTIFIALGIIGVCLIIAFFMVKFVFSRQKTDLSQLLKITRSDEPRLFAMIDEIVEQAGCKFPKNVYISHEVNASVFYDSSFWSMFLPIRKNLMIGAGLINSVTEGEFKAILAHEFGHFAQKSMAIGSYVHNSNRVLFNLLYDNRSMDKLLATLSELGIVGYVLTHVGMAIVQGIRWILLQVYKLVNLQYLSLSREMELHADAFAASIAGKKPLIDSLLRTSLSEYAYNYVLGFYNERISQNIRTENLFPQHRFVLHFLAEKNRIDTVNDLPHVTEERVQQFNKSLLRISNPWESHPENEVRIAALSDLNGQTPVLTGPAANIFTDFEHTGRAVTQRLFDSVPMTGPKEVIDSETFRTEFTREYENNSFDDIFTGYYNTYDPSPKSSIELMRSSDQEDTGSDALFSEEISERMQRYKALEQDREAISQIAAKQAAVRVFEYNGKPYKRKEAKLLAQQLLARIEAEKAYFEEHDGKIFRLLVRSATMKNAVFVPHWDRYLAFIADADQKRESADNVVKGMGFIGGQLEAADILRRIKVVKPYEQVYKDAVKDMLDNPDYGNSLKDDARKCFESYLEKDLPYFYADRYAEQELQLLSDSIYWFRIALDRALFQNKKQLLDIQAKLLN